MQKSTKENTKVHPELTYFTALNRWLEKWKHIYSVREKRLSGEADDRMRFPQQQDKLGLNDYQLCQNYKPRKILNLDELGLFFKALSKKILMEREKKTKGAKKSKQHMIVMFTVASEWARLFLNQLLSGDQKDHAVLCPLKIYKDQCLCTTFPIKKFGWTQTLWRVFCQDLTAKCS